MHSPRSRVWTGTISHGDSAIPSCRPQLCTISYHIFLTKMTPNCAILSWAPLENDTCSSQYNSIRKHCQTHCNEYKIVSLGIQSKRRSARTIYYTKARLEYTIIGRFACLDGHPEVASWLKEKRRNHRNRIELKHGKMQNLDV